MRKMRSLIFVFLLLLCAAARCTAGEASPAPPYRFGAHEISSSEHLAWLAANVNAGTRDEDGVPYGEKSYRLIGDIDISHFANWTPIGTFDHRFAGSFDGGGYAIRGLTITDPGSAHGTGLFGCVRGTAERRAFIGNLVLRAVTISAAEGDAASGKFVGALCGLADYLTIYRCEVAGEVAGERYVGGIVGLIQDGEISRSFSSARVWGREQVGGVCGPVRASRLEYVDASGDVFAAGSNAGGLASAVWDASTLAQCRADGNVTGDDWVGGLAGSTDEVSFLYECFAGGNVSGRYTVGGLVGANFGYIAACAATGAVNGGRSVGDVVGRDYTKPR